jgi:formylglycine-generating enzyme required for sulfatase activity
MKIIIRTMVACLLLTACSQPIKAKNSEHQALVDRTLQNMVFVEGGSFMMGDQKNTHVDIFGNEVYNYYFPGAEFDNARPAHKVTLDNYYMGKYEVTYEEHDVFTAATGSAPTNKRDWDRIRSKETGELSREVSLRQRAPEIPAGVSWHGAKEYCEWLGDQTGLPFDLPTEAQWEYAARSRGKLVPFATDTGLIDEGRNYSDGSNRNPYPPGKFPSNPLGLYDMSGNAYEWVQDWYDPEYYSRSPEHNPRGAETGKTKVIRGGGVNNSPGGSSTVLREGSYYYEKEYRSVGFRCVINTDKALPVENRISSK